MPLLAPPLEPDSDALLLIFPPTTPPANVDVVDDALSSDERPSMMISRIKGEPMEEAPSVLRL